MGGITVTSTGFIVDKIDNWKIIHDTLSGFRKVFGANGMRRKTLTVFSIIFFFKRLRRKINHDNREAAQREKARIWEEEKIKVQKEANEEGK